MNGDPLDNSISFVDVGLEFTCYHCRSWSNIKVPSITPRCRSRSQNSRLLEVPKLRLLPWAYLQLAVFASFDTKDIDRYLEDESSNSILYPSRCLPGSIYLPPRTTRRHYHHHESIYEERILTTHTIMVHSLLRPQNSASNIFSSHHHRHPAFLHSSLGRRRLGRGS